MEGPVDRNVDGYQIKQHFLKTVLNRQHHRNLSLRGALAYRILAARQSTQINAFQRLFSGQPHATR
jgi:hypothetical protein